MIKIGIYRYILIRLIILLIVIFVGQMYNIGFIDNDISYYSLLILSIINLVLIYGSSNRDTVSYNFNNDVKNALKNQQQDFERFDIEAEYYNKLINYYPKVRYEVILYMVLFLFLDIAVGFIILNIFILIELINIAYKVEKRLNEKNTN